MLGIMDEVGKLRVYMDFFNTASEGLMKPLAMMIIFSLHCLKPTNPYCSNH